MSLELYTWSRPASEQARPGDGVRTTVRRTLSVHGLPTTHRQAGPSAGRGAGGSPTGVDRLPSIASLHHRARVLLGLALIGSAVIALALGSFAVLPLVVCTSAAAVTYLQPPLRVTA